ncbi:alpha-crystallin [Streptosporangium violaceochromogenes]|nr:alpha-crystallin [Streptosporangium violaceochromogenes]
MSMLTRREQRGLFPELLELLDVPFGTMRTQTQSIRFEDYVKNGRYVLRAELPGVNPENIEIDVNNGILTIRAEREEEEREQQRTEFRYGSFTRSITLPMVADEKDIKAVYDKGVLEVSVKLARPEEKSRRIPVEDKSHAHRK